MRRSNERTTESAPDRPRIGVDEHPNLVRPGAQPHPRSARETRTHRELQDQRRRPGA